MAYNLQSLITIIEGILNPEQTRWIVDHNKPQLQYLLEKATSLRQLLDKSSLAKIGSLEGRIRDAAYKAEDIIESHMVDSIPNLNLSLSTPALNSTFSTPDLNFTLSTMEEDIVDLKKVGVMIFDLESGSWTYAKEDLNLTLSTPALKFRFSIPDLNLTLSAPDLDFAMVESLRFSTSDLLQVTDELDSVMQQVEKLIKGKTISSDTSSSGASFSHGLTSDVQQATQQLVEVPAGSSPSGASFTTSKSVVVGINADLKQLKDRLIRKSGKLEIVPIVGMGGIGKTTLARKLYEDPLIVSHFNLRAWTTVSQSYNVQSILLSLIRCITGKESNQDKDIGDLKVDLHQSLCRGSYMIVLDDIWSKEVWDKIRKYFPDKNNGSRILITTRELDVAKHADSQTLPHQVELLSKSKSWKLLCQIVFGRKYCPDHVLQEIGKKIASDCSGLPLAIKVIGGLLSKVERSKDVWEKIGENVRVAIRESDEQISNILSLSYNHLPYYLKPCFLYMGAFPEDYEIKGSRLIPIWVAEGFVRSNIGSKSMEEEAEDCVKALVERNLLMVREYKYAKPRSYIMHDLLRDLCIRKAGEEKFLHIKNSPKATFSNPRRVSVQISHGTEDAYASAKSMPLARSFIRTSREWSYDINQSCVFLALRLLRVLDVRDVRIKTFPREIFEFVNLRFLAVSCNSRIPSGISRLWNLQTLIADSLGFDVPYEIWKLSELRYLKLRELKLLNIDALENIVLKKLETISGLVLHDSVFRWHDFFKSIPNVKKLGICYKGGDSSSFVVDLSHLHKLETLSCHDSQDSENLSRVEFPCNLRKLTFYDCLIPPGFTTTLCTLPNLEVLKIRKCEIGSDKGWNEKWELAEEGDEFGSLQFLLLMELDIESWRADETNFPKLRHLYIQDCYYLEEIPSGIGEIPTLQLIQLDKRNPSLVASARKIVKEQQSDYLQLRIIKRDDFLHWQKELGDSGLVAKACRSS